MRNSQYAFCAMYFTTLLTIVALWPADALAMRSSTRERLRQETIEVFYHGYDNYMQHAFPEDEVSRLIRCLG
jgi:hypothetical protein